MKECKLPNDEKLFCIDKLTALYVYREIYEEKVYMEHGLKVMDGDVIFDVGANIGLFSRYISSLANCLKIYTFEPIPTIFEVLEANLSQIPANVRNYNIGLGETNQSIEFNYYPKVSADSAAVPFEWERKLDLYVKNYKEAICKDMPIARLVPKFLRRRVVAASLKTMYKPEKVTCQIRTMSDIIEENKIKCINFLKVDAENYEKQVLAGIKDEHWDMIQQIAMEVHTHIKGGENLLNEIKDLFTSKGFQIFEGEESRESLMGVYMLYAKR